MASFEEATTSKFMSILNREGGVLRNNRFGVMISPPPSSVMRREMKKMSADGLDLSIFGIMEHLFFVCSKANIPGREFLTSDIIEGGISRKSPYGSGYGDVTMTFLCTARNFVERRFFETWTNAIAHPLTKGFNYRNEYASTIDIHVMDSLNKVIYGVQLQQAWPLSYTDVEVDTTSQNTIHEFGVNFTYEKIKNLDYKDSQTQENIEEEVTTKLNRYLGPNPNIQL